jgi:hypothetical protein
MFPRSATYFDYTTFIKLVEINILIDRNSGRDYQFKGVISNRGSMAVVIDTCGCPDNKC